MLWTMRSGAELDEAVLWFHRRDIPLFGVNRNPQQGWTTSPKPYAQLYIDDAALGCPLTAPGQRGARRHVDWEKVAQLLLEEGYLLRETGESVTGWRAGHVSRSRRRDLLASFISYIGKLL
jgi:hypothetical protein